MLNHISTHQKSKFLPPSRISYTDNQDNSAQFVCIYLSLSHLAAIQRTKGEIIYLDYNVSFDVEVIYTLFVKRSILF